jgi:hypothetical protein
MDVPYEIIIIWTENNYNSSKLVSTKFFLFFHSLSPYNSFSLLEVLLCTFSFYIHVTGEIFCLIQVLFQADFVC